MSSKGAAVIDLQYSVCDNDDNLFERLLKNITYTRQTKADNGKTNKQTVNIDDEKEEMKKTAN